MLSKKSKDFVLAFFVRLVVVFNIMISFLMKGNNSAPDNPKYQR